MTNADLPTSLMVRMEGPRPPDDFVSNGITGAPDFIGAVDCRPAGHWHDYSYSLGSDELDRERFDYEFFRNLRMSDLPYGLAQIEFRRVRLWGIWRFNYADPPRGWRKVWLVLWCFFSRYMRFEN